MTKNTSGDHRASVPALRNGHVNTLLTIITMAVAATAIVYSVKGDVRSLQMTVEHLTEVVEDVEDRHTTSLNAINEILARCRDTHWEHEKRIDAIERGG